VIQKEAAPLIPAGYIVAIEQFKLPLSIPKQAYTGIVTIPRYKWINPETASV
jgi:beta-galactosidase